MKKIVLLLVLILMLCSCGTGAVYVAKTEQESFKTYYEHPELKRLYTENDDTLRAIYRRLREGGIDVYKEGIGFTYLTNTRGERIPYLMVNIRPMEIVFDVNKTNGEGRFAVVFQRYLPRYLKLMKKEDLRIEKIEGLEFGVYWPVRDFSQCDQYGGFIEYLHVYSKKEDVRDYLDDRIGFKELTKNSEVYISLDLQPAKSVMPLFD
ncbi:MAG: hypothetical protein N2745_10615 [Syntrophorhabdaceae bacterium]|nr:hypothetical protein [Syntrophorhabdaceae bacterium]